MIRQQKRGQFTLKRKEVNKLIQSAKTPRDRLIIKLLVFCGLRRQEVADIKIQDIDFNRERIKIIGKGSKERVIPVPPEVIQDIKFWIGTSRQDWLFPSNRKTNEPVCIRVINMAVRYAGERAKLKSPDPGRKFINPHLLRHTFARMCKDKDLPLEVIQNLLGHKHFSSTMDQYGLLSMNEIHNRVRSAFSY